MSSSSRVPLLVGSKGRKPSRLPIAPRARPSNVDRTKRPSSSEDATSEQPGDEQPQTTTASPVKAPHSPERKALPPVLPVAMATSQPAPVAATAVRSAGGISPGHSISSSRLGTFRGQHSGSVISTRTSPLLNPSAAAGSRVATSPVERLSKISSKTVVPLFRPQEPRTHASPILGPRATAIPAPQGPPSEHPEPNPMLKRLTRKLDIKPHQSPRRAALNQNANVPLRPSPLVLPTPALEVPEELLDTLKNEEPQAKKRGTKRPNPASTPRGSKKASKKPATPRRSIRRKVKKDDSYKTEETGDSHDDTNRAGDSDDDEEYDDEEADEDENETENTTDGSRRRRIKLPKVEKPPVYMPARERATLWAKKVLRDQDADDGDDVAGDARKKRRNRSNSVSSLTSLSTNATTVSRKSKAEENSKKEPSQMTMGELAMSIPMGRRMQRHEQEELPDTASVSSHGNRIRSLSMSSDVPSFGGGSVVTPQVEIIDGKMVILEATVKLTDTGTGSEYGDDSSRRTPGSRYLNTVNPPGKRWGKDETKQFYYCLSQVGPNFSMMATLFPSRKRKELKSKFKYEEKHHPDLIEIALQASAAPLDSEIVDVIGQIADKEIQKKEEKKRRKNSTGSLGNDDDDDDVDLDALHSPATVSSSAVVPSPSRDEGMEFDDEHLGDFYRERKNSFDFAG